MLSLLARIVHGVIYFRLGNLYRTFFSRKPALSTVIIFSCHPFSGYLISSMALRKYKSCMLEGSIAMHAFVLFVSYK